MSTRFPFFVSEIPVSVPRVTRPSFKEAAGIVPERKPERQCSYLIETESSVRHCLIPHGEEVEFEELPAGALDRSP
jgi:hypothetical protein